LRALGATRRQIRALFLDEGAVAGLIGSAAGAVAGLDVARVLASGTSQILEDFFGVAHNVPESAIDPKFLLFALALGVLTSVVAAAVPARNAARVHPVQTLQKGKYQVLSAGENRFRRNVALGALAVALVALAFSRWRLAFYTGYALTVVAAHPVPIRGTGPIAARTAQMAPTRGRLAGRRQSPPVSTAHLRHGCRADAFARPGDRPGRIARGSYVAIKEWSHHNLNPDLFVATSETLASRDFSFPSEHGSRSRSRSRASTRSSRSVPRASNSRGFR
jgi:hypothetical protein